MEDMRVCIANISECYNEGELVEAWFEPPIDFDEVKERIGLNSWSDEYAIHNYELPFDIDEYTPIEEINRLCALVKDFPNYVQDNLGKIMCYYGSLDALANVVDDIYAWYGCDSLSDVVDKLMWDEDFIKSRIVRYIDRTDLERALDIEYHWVEVGGMMLQLPL